MAGLDRGALAVALRLAVAFGSARPVLEFDSLEYATLARHIRFDHSFSFGAVHRWSGPITDDPSGRLHPTAWRAPLFPLFMAGLWWNSADSPPVRTVQVVNALLGGVTAGLTCSIAAALAPAMALPAGLISAAWPLGVITDAAPMSEALFTVLLMAGLWWWQRNAPVAAGISFGAACLTRVTLLPLLVLIPLFTLWPRLRRRGLITISLCSLLTIAPWTVRNLIVLHRAIPVATAGSGANLLLGSVFVRPFSGGNLWSDFSRDPDVERVLSQGLEDSDAETAMRRLAVSRIAAHPAAWLVGRVLQYPRFLIDAGEYWPQLGFAPGLPRIMSFLASAGLLTLAGLGAFSLRREWTMWLPILLLTGTLLLMHLPILAERRHGAPLIPLFAILLAARRRGLSLVPLVSDRRLVES